MENEDHNMFVVIIGDEEENNSSADIQTSTIKIEELETFNDFLVEEIIEKAKMYGEPLNVKNLYIKKRPLCDSDCSDTDEISSVKNEFTNSLVIKEEPLDDPADENGIPYLDKEIKEAENHIKKESEQKNKILKPSKDSSHKLRRDEFSDKFNPPQSLIVENTKMFGKALFVKDSFLKSCDFEDPNIDEITPVNNDMPIFLDIKEEPLDASSDENFVPYHDKKMYKFKRHIKRASKGRIKISKPSKETSNEFRDKFNLQANQDCNKETWVSKRKQKENAEEKTRLLKPSEPNSFIKKLFTENPNYKKDKDLLTDVLYGIMKNQKTPPLPRKYYKLSELGFSCVKCEANTRSEPAAGRHYQEHHGPRYLLCFACGADFRSKTNLLRHEKTCKAPYIEQVLKARAKYVGLKGRSRPYLEYAQSLRFPGAIKDKKATRKLHKTNVYKRETGKLHKTDVCTRSARFQCDQCSASYSTMNSLMGHKHKHAGERPFLCAECPTAYTTSDGLWRHMMTHRNLKFICDYCKKEFKVKKALATHLSTHLPQKPFPCKECPKRFAQKMALDLHVDLVHRKLPPPCACQLCPKRFRRMSVLKVHMREKHGVTLMTRSMFFKLLPKMSQSLIQQGKVFLQNDVMYYKNNKSNENKDHDNTESNEYNPEDFLKQLSSQAENEDQRR